MDKSILQALNITIPQQVNNMMAYHLMLARKYTIGYKGLNLSKKEQSKFFTERYRNEVEFFQTNRNATHSHHPYDDSPVTETLVSSAVIYGRSLLNFFRIFLKPGDDMFSFGTHGHQKGKIDLHIDTIFPEKYPTQSSLKPIFNFFPQRNCENEINQFLIFANRYPAHITTEQKRIPAPEDQEYINQAKLSIYQLFKQFLAPNHPEKSQSEYLRKIWYYDQIES